MISFAGRAPWQFTRVSADDRARTAVPHEAMFQGQVCEFVELLRGRWMDVHPLRRSDGDRRTPTNCAWPDLTIWFPLAGGGLHLVECKSDTGRVSDDQGEVFDSLNGAGVTVHVWRPGQWGSVVEPTLRAWARGTTG